MERQEIIEALEAAKGNRTQAAKLLGISRAQLYYLMYKYDIGGKQEYGVGDRIEISEPKASFEPISRVRKVEKSESDCWYLASEIILSNSFKRILLYGPPGTGKTYFGKQALGNCEVLTLTNETSVSEILGHYLPVGQGQFKWVDGYGIRAWKKSSLLLNEIDKASGSVLTILHAILDDIQIAQYTLPTGEVVRPNGHFRCIATMNGSPLDLPEALADRFEVKIYINEPHPDAIDKLEIDLQKICLRAYTDTDNLITYRQFRAFQKLRKVLKWEIDAARIAFGEAAEDLLNTIQIGRRDESEES